MKNTAPLTPAEIREGVARLMSSPFMQSPKGRKGDDGKEDDWTGALDAAADARSTASSRLFPLAEKWGLEGNVPGIVEELGFTLLMNRTSVEELFRIGTSAEAVQLLEEEHARHVAWQKSVRAERAAKAEEAGA